AHRGEGRPYPVGCAAGAARGRRAARSWWRRRGRGCRMNPFQTLLIAVRALLRNKMRSFLTTLGVVIGVGAVIAMVAIGEGAKASVAAQFAAMGTDLLIVTSGSATAGGARGGSGSAPTITWEDVAAITAQLRSVRYVAPNLR